MLATVSPHTVKRLRTDGAVGQLVIVVHMST
jgi:hypothetical protein